MARIAGVDLPRDKRVDIGLTYIYGIGRSGAAQIVKKSGVAAATRVKDLKEDEIVKLREIIERDYEVDGHLSRVETSQGVAGPGTAHEDQCPNPERQTGCHRESAETSSQRSSRERVVVLVRRERDRS